MESLSKSLRFGNFLLAFNTWMQALKYSESVRVGDISEGFEILLRALGFDFCDFLLTTGLEVDKKSRLRSSMQFPEL